MKRKRIDVLGNSMRFKIASINAINEHRNESVKHCVNQQQKETVDERAFALRERLEKS